MPTHYLHIEYYPYRQGQSLVHTIPLNLNIKYYSKCLFFFDSQVSEVCVKVPGRKNLLSSAAFSKGFEERSQPYCLENNTR